MPDSIPDPDSSEPALSVGVVTTAVTAALTLAVTFGLDLSTAQTAAILGTVAALAPLVSAWFTRGRVYSPQSVAQLMRLK